jgi:predicted ATPase
MESTFNLENNRTSVNTQTYKNFIAKQIDDNIDRVLEYQAGDITQVLYFVDRYKVDNKTDILLLKKIITESLKNWKAPTFDGEYITDAIIERDMTPFSAGEKFKFSKGVNLFVGDQGCGKSTLLHMLMYYQTEYKEIINVTSTPFKGDYLFFDSEKHNPRNMSGEEGGRSDISSIRNFIRFSNENGGGDKEMMSKYLEETFEAYGKMVSVGADPLMDAITSRLKSHGETLLPMLEKFVKAKFGIIFIDEPETALSIKSQYKFVEILKRAVESKCQVFISTHSQIIMEGVEKFMKEDVGVTDYKILSLEHKKQMGVAEFIKTQII